MHRSLWLLGHWRRMQEQAKLDDDNDDGCNDEYVDVDDGENEYEYISDSDDSDDEFN